MKLHQESKTVRIKMLDGKTIQRTIFTFNGTKVSTDNDCNSTNKAKETFTNYFANATNKKAT